MSLKDYVHSLYKKNTDYSHPEQAINLTQSINALSRDLYTDSKRFVYELIQNADDSPDNNRIGVNVCLKLFGDVLVVAHNGKDFSERDLRGICGVNDGTKKKASGKTGYKGIGFKAVFGQSRKVTIYSGGEYFKFDAQHQPEWKEEWGIDQSSWETENDRLFEYPWQIIPIYVGPSDVPLSIHEFLRKGSWTVATMVKLLQPEETVKAVEELAGQANMFLFLKNVHQLDFQVGSRRIIRIDRSDDNAIFSVKVNDKEISQWLKRTVQLAVPDSVSRKIASDPNVPDKLKAAKQVELTIGAQLGESGLCAVELSERLLYAYLPTEERRYAFPMLVNTAFLTTANRESLHDDSPWNQWLFSVLPKEMLAWIAQLVQGEYEYQAYRLLPSLLLTQDALSVAYNNGFKIALESVPFVFTESKTVVRVQEAVIDFTFLYRKDFVGREAIRRFTAQAVPHPATSLLNFVPKTGFGKELKRLGVSFFDWKEVPDLLATAQFSATHTIAHNIELIQHFKQLCAGENPTLSESNLQEWPFIYDHKGVLKRPADIYFPAPGDSHWDSSVSELSFLHPQIQEWVSTVPDVRAWLERIGIVEKSDLSYLTKTIIPSASEFISYSNAIKTIRDIFSLYAKGAVGADILQQLHLLKLKTKNGSLRPAAECYLPDAYRPRLPLEAVLEEDFYVSDGYIAEGQSKDEWKRFFKMMGVKEGIQAVCFTNRSLNTTLIAQGFDSSYFETEDKSFAPFLSTFEADEFAGLTTLDLLSHTSENNFARSFWKDVIENEDITLLSKPATAYWGHSGKAGRTTGSSVQNYLSWYIQNVPCIPTSKGVVGRAASVFINEAANIELLGCYLPVFQGPNLSEDWKAFFRFKIRPDLGDYLALIDAVVQDSGDGNRIKKESQTRVQSAIEYLLQNCTSWDEEQRQLVNDWSLSARLPDKEGLLKPCHELKYYADGDPTIFQGAYAFIHLNAANRRHPDIETLLSMLGIVVLKQDQFQLRHENPIPATPLRKKLETILPFWVKWMQRLEEVDYDKRLFELESRLEQLQLFEADKLLISYGVDWQKAVPLHLQNSVLYLAKPWTSHKVLYNLPEKLCAYFYANGYDRELLFLLQASEEETREYFVSENIDWPLAAPMPDLSSDATAVTDGRVAKVSTFGMHIDYSQLRALAQIDNEELHCQGPNHPQELLLYGLSKNTTWDGCIYHYTHLENATRILQERLLKSRAMATFKDSAGSAIIDHTELEKKENVRFYFRPKTPTQYYNENFGKGEISKEKLGNEPVCPVPVFFKIPLKDLLDSRPGLEWKVSTGNLAVNGVPYGNSIDIIRQFDFKWLMTSPGSGGELDRVFNAAQQEFLIKDQLCLQDLNFQLVVQDPAAKESLEALLEGFKWEEKISVDSSLFHFQNPRVIVHFEENVLHIENSNIPQGFFVVQLNGLGNWYSVGNKVKQHYQCGGQTTIFASDKISIHADFAQIKYNVFYCYKGQLWLVHTNGNSPVFDTGFIKQRLAEWSASASMNPVALLQTLELHPELNYWFNHSIGGPDGLNLEAHTLAVLQNYLDNFSGMQKVLEEERQFLILLVLHDIGKPKAILAGNKNSQHDQTKKLIDGIAPVLDLDVPVLHRIKSFIDGDPIGRYLNPQTSVNLEETIANIQSMATSLDLKVEELWNTLVIYYQCDAGGYGSLRDKLFLRDAKSNYVFSEDKTRWIFSEGYEEKFQLLNQQLLS